MKSKLHSTTIKRNKEFNALRKFYGNKCINCNSKIKIEFAHILPTKLKGLGRGKPERIKDIKENPKCYILLCNKCHKEFDKINDESERRKEIIKFNQKKIEIIMLRTFEKILKTYDYNREIDNFLCNFDKSLCNNSSLQRHKELCIKMIDVYLN